MNIETHFIPLYHYLFLKFIQFTMQIGYFFTEKYTDFNILLVLFLFQRIINIFTLKS